MAYDLLISPSVMPPSPTDEEEMVKYLLDASDRPVTWLSISSLEEKPGAAGAAHAGAFPGHVLRSS